MHSGITQTPTPTATKPLSRTMRTLAVLGGADPRILAIVPEAAFRFAELAWVLFGTAAIAGLSMAFALTTGVGLPLGVAAVLAVGWALVIFNLDRFLTTQIKSTRNVAKLAGAAIPRVVLAAIIGIIVAVPMTIQIFQSEVDAEVARMAREESQALNEELEGGNVAARVQEAREKVAALEAQAAGLGGGAADDGRVTSARDKVDRAKSAWDAKEHEAKQAELLFQCDRYGDEAARAQLDDPSKCSPLPGPNGLAQQYEAEAKRLRSEASALSAEYQTALSELDQAEATVAGEIAATASQRRAQAEAAIPGALAELADLEAESAALAAEARSKIQAADGLLAQIEALNRLSASPAMGQAHLAVMALFFTIELLPVIVKMFMAYGDRSLYEITDDNENKRLALEGQIRRDTATKRVEGAAQRDIAVEADMQEREKRLGIEANEFVERRVQEIVQDSLTQWAASFGQSTPLRPQATQDAGARPHPASSTPASMPAAPTQHRNGAAPTQHRNGAAPAQHRNGASTVPVAAWSDLVVPNSAGGPTPGPQSPDTQVSAPDPLETQTPQRGGMLTSGFIPMDAENI